MNPLKRLSRKQQKLVKKPWIMMHDMNYDCNAEKIYFGTYSNKLTKIISKKLYFQNELKKNKNNARKTWDIIKSTLPITPNRQLTNSLRINDIITEDPKIIVNEFNNFFCSIGSNLAEKIKKRQISHFTNI